MSDTYPAQAYRDALWADDTLSVTQLVVALCYANHARRGDRAWVTYSRLMQQTKIKSSATITAAITALVADGWLERAETTGGHKQQVYYRLTIPTASVSEVVIEANNLNNSGGLNPEPPQQMTEPPQLLSETTSVTDDYSFDSPDSKELSRASSRPDRPAFDAQISEPPRACPKHLDEMTPPPCGSCKAAREAYERWQAAKRRRIDESPKCRIPGHNGQLAHNCALCRSEALVENTNRPTASATNVIPFRRPDRKAS